MGGSITSNHNAHITTFDGRIDVRAIRSPTQVKIALLHSLTILLGFFQLWCPFLPNVVDIHIVDFLSYFIFLFSKGVIICEESEVFQHLVFEVIDEFSIIPLGYEKGILNLNVITGFTFVSYHFCIIFGNEGFDKIVMINTSSLK